MKTVFFDVDTQLDFLAPAGALSVPGGAEIAGGVSALARFAAANRIQVISTVDAHQEDDPEFKVWKPHCVVGTQGQQKLSGTLLPERQTLGRFATGAGLLSARQIIVEKHTLDPFSNCELPVLLGALGARRYVVYGLATEYCVSESLFQLLRTGRRVELVADATKCISRVMESETIRRFRQQGGLLIGLADVFRLANQGDDVLSGGQ